MVEDLVLPEPALLFVNSFGVEEFLHCCGTLKRDSKYTRSSTRIRSRLKNYHITEEKQFTANTGWMTDAMAEWADELFRSEEVYLWGRGSRGHEVVVSDSKSEWKNEDDFLVAYEFTYTYAQQTHNVLVKKQRSRIFSEQFEEIYN
jgi:hypothetical protein